MDNIIIKNKTIIILQGAANSGKTTTLKLLIDELSEMGYAIEEKINEPDDVCVIVRVHNKSIGICTGGDYVDEIKRRLSEIKDCDIIVCPCRSKGKTYQYFKELQKDNNVYYHTRWGIWHYKDDCEVNDTDNLRKKANEAQAEALAKFICCLA